MQTERTGLLMDDTRKNDGIGEDAPVTGGDILTSADQPVKRKRGRPKGSKDKVKRDDGMSRMPRYRHAMPAETIKVLDTGTPKRKKEDGTEVPTSDPVQVVIEHMDASGKVDATNASVPVRTKQAVSKRPTTGRFQNEWGADRTEPGDNSRYIRYALMSLDLPVIDISDPKQVQDRLLEYFTFCMDHDRKPSLIGMANWLGVDKKTVDLWKRGDMRAETHTPIIQRAVALLEELSVDYFQNGKVNPAAGIFLLKNMFQYRDVQDIVVTPNNPLGDAAQQDQLEDKYLDIVDIPDDGE